MKKLCLGFIGTAAIFLAFVSNSFAENWVPVYRLVVAGGGCQDHLYTTSASERQSAIDTGYIDEGIPFYVSSTSFSGGQQIYRLRKNSTCRLRLYTSSVTEKDQAIANGYVLEGTLGYAYSTSVSGTYLVYRVWKSSIGDRFYTIDYSEAAAAVADGYTWESSSNFGYVKSFPNLTPYKPSGWSDKIVVSKTTGTTTDDTPLYSTDNLYVDWAIINHGSSGITTRFYIYLYVDGSLKTSWYCDSLGIYPYYHVTVLDYSLGKLTAGSHTIKIVTDATGVVSEGDETDNEYTKTIYINAPIVAPQPTYPPNGAVFAYATPSFSWTAGSGFNYFHLQVDNNSDFSSPVINKSDIQDLTYSVTSPLPEGTYYWHVRGYNQSAGVWSDFSETCNFTIDLTEDPVLVSPIDGTDVTSTTITFDWQDVSGATRYELLVDNNSGFSSPEINKTDLTSSYYQVSDWLPTNRYYWRVRAYGASGYIGEAQSYFDYVPADASTLPVFAPFHRLYHSANRDHFYTYMQAQVDAAIAQGYTYEKIEGYVSSKKFSGSTPLMRLYRNSDRSHFYTIYESEKDQKIIDGFVYEGLAGYVYGSGTTPTTVALYHVYKASDGDHFYTINKPERDYAIQYRGYVDYGVACYVSADGKVNPFSYGRPSGYVGWGVNTAVGSFEINDYTHTDLSVPGVNLPFAFIRSYNSDYALVDGPLGYGWTHSYNVKLIDNGSTAVIQWGDGNDDFYNVSGSVYTSAEPGVYDILVKNADGSYTLTKKDQTKYKFSVYTADLWKEARLDTIEEKNGNKIKLNYDSYQRLYRIDDTTNRSYTFTYTDATAQGKIAYLTDPIGRVFYFSYINGNLTKFKNAKGGETNYEYSPTAGQEHKLIKVTLPRSNSYTVSYDSSGKVSSQKEGTSNPLTLTYTSPTTTTVTDPEGNNTYYTHNDKYCLTNFKDSLGKIAEVEYGDTRFLNSTRPTHVKDRKGYHTYFSYDERGNVLTYTNALSQTTSYTYYSNNNLKTLTDGRSNTTYYYYDDYGNLNLIRDPLSHETAMTYNSYGQLESVTDAEGRSISYYYTDIRRNLTMVEDELGNKTLFSYDGVSRKILMTDPNGGYTSYNYDANDNLETTVDPLNQPTVYGYDANDNLISITDARNNHVYFTYNDRDKLSQETDALSRIKYYYYDDVGNLEKVIDFIGNTIQYFYNDNNLLEKILYPDSSQVTFEYDENDNRKKMVDKYGTTNYTYDAVNRLSSYTNAYGKVVTYEYDAAGNRIKIIYPGNKTVNYGYDNANRLTSVIDWNSKTTIYGYDNSNFLTSITYPNSTTTSYAYDVAKRLTNLYNRKSDASVISSYAFTLDKIGNPTQIDLTEPLSAVLSAENTTSTYNAGNQLVTSGSFSYTYDYNGNRKMRSGGGGPPSNYYYDYENMLTQFYDGTYNYYFKYNGDRHRICALRNDVETRYVLDVNGNLEQVLMETDSGNNPTAYYIYGLGLIDKIDTAGNHYYYHYNWRGDTVAISNASQSIVNKYRYDEFGNIINSNEGISNPFAFMGKYGCAKEISNLVFVRARYYDSKTGSFLQRDPEGQKEGVNLYIYAANNPTAYFDPKGRWTESAIRTSIGLSKLLYHRIKGNVIIRDKSEFYAILSSKKGGWDIRKLMDCKSLAKSFLKEIITSYSINKFMDWYTLKVEGSKGEDAPGILGKLQHIPVAGDVLGNIFGHVKSAGGDIPEDYSSVYSWTFTTGN